MGLLLLLSSKSGMGKRDFPQLPACSRSAAEVSSKSNGIIETEQRAAPRNATRDFSSLPVKTPPRSYRKLSHTTLARMANALNTIYRFAIPIAGAVGLAQASLYDVKGGSRAIIFDRLSGVKDGVINEGTHFLVPWLQKAIVYDVRTKPRNISTTTGSKDLQMVSLTLRVLHRPEVAMLPKIYQVC